MTNLQTFKVFPAIPKSLAFLEKLSRNLWWCWHYDAIELFRRIDPKLWVECSRNPVFFLNSIPQARFDSLSQDESFLDHQKRVQESFSVTVDRLISEIGAKHGDIAYFSMEFGLHESLPLFAGGLGVLAGDHLKSSSNIGIPLVGIGLMYREGYFHQILDQEGWQQERYPENDIFHLPVSRARDSLGNAVKISITGPDGEINAIVWKVDVGCSVLYLLDTNLPENPPVIRSITSRLYAGEQKTRLSQEILLGIGGMRALEKLGIFPKVCHMNEGHCAFVSLERLAQIMKKYTIDMKTAIEIVLRSTVFTTHTPVAAGHDEFPVDLVRPYIIPLTDRLKSSENEILSLGQLGNSGNEPLSMFVLALRMSQYCNGVSELHGRTARRMWAHVWPKRPVDEVPITHVTNGVHIFSYMSREMSMLFERYLGTEWNIKPWNPQILQRIDEFYDEELWHAHEINRSRLIRLCRKLLVAQYSRRNAPKRVIDEAKNVLDQNALTICFARRFTPYKRANLLLMDIKRLESIITSTKLPVQFIFAGKAHPKDTEGKELIKRLIQFARQPNMRSRIVFIEDYDINIARYMVQGADIWLNTPRRPFEACGTSGIKAAVNGVLNLSILDGWWCEGYKSDRGWCIGKGEEYSDHSYQDIVESQAFYNVLEDEVIPCFYDRESGNPPYRWIKMVKESMKMAMRDFSSHRMVSEYNERFYIPLANQMEILLKDNAQETLKFSTQRERLKKYWHLLSIDQPVGETNGRFFRVGDNLKLTSKVYLGELRPDEVEIELYYGQIKSIDTILCSKTKKMDIEQVLGDGYYIYSCIITCEYSGRYGFTARVVPQGDELIKFAPGFITWAK